MKTTEIINRFLADGSWMNKAKEYANNPEKMRTLLEKFENLFDTEGLQEVKDNLAELFHYAKDVTSGRYPDYSIMAFVKIVAGILYVVSPVDLIPDFLPAVGWTDDVAVILYVVRSTSDELGRYRRSKQHMC